MKIKNLCLVILVFTCLNISFAQTETLKSKNYICILSYKDSLLDNIIIKDKNDSVFLSQDVLVNSSKKSNINLSKLKFKKNKTFSYILFSKAKQKTINKSVCIIHYIGYFSNGIQFDNSFQRKEPLYIDLKKNYFLHSFTKAIQVLNTGDFGIIKIDPKYAYGDTQIGNIPSNSTLYYLIEMVGEK